MANKKRLKILFIPAWYPSKQNSVAGIFIKEYAKAVSLYNDVVVLYSERIGYSLKSFYEIKDNKEDRLRTIHLKYRKSPIPKTSFFVYQLGMFLAFRKLIQSGWKPDIIHAYVFSAGVPAIILGKIYKIPVVITELYTNFATHTLVNCEKIMAKFAMNRARYVLPISIDLMEAIENYYKIKNRFMVIPCVVNTTVYYPLKFNPNKERSNKKRMLTVCNLIPRKGINYLLESLSQLKQKRQDFTLDIVGDGPNRKEYEELTEKFGLDKIVKFYGRQPEIVSFMRNCDFFVLPSLYENFGVVYIEAMACGKPVIGTLGGGPKEIINKDTGILVPTKDIEDLTSAIDYMLDHYQDYSSEKISQYAKENFSYEIVGKKIDGIYRKVIL